MIIPLQYSKVQLRGPRCGNGIIARSYTTARNLTVYNHFFVINNDLRFCVW
jgi:predicted RNA-binding Zn-ribbon protein involved in translation (DUF1610 family)